MRIIAEKYHNGFADGPVRYSLRKIVIR